MHTIERRRARVRAGESRPRPGVTLVELMITLVLLGIVAGGMMQIIARQQKFYNGNSSVLGTRSNVRQGVAVFQSDLRGINPGRDIYSGGMKSTSIEFREPRGSSVICAIDGSRTTIVVPPPVLASGVGFTSWVDAPVAGDSVLVFNPSTRLWDTTPRVITGSDPTEGSGTCTSALIRDASDLARGWQMTLDPALPLNVGVGASLRFFRKARYELMQAADGNWYLGFRDCTTVSCEDPRPIAGPYLAADNVPPGLQLDYYDANGNLTADPTALRRVDITLRSQSSVQVDMDGRAKGFYRDSLKTSIAFRNLQ